MTDRILHSEDDILQAMMECAENTAALSDKPVFRHSHEMIIHKYGLEFYREYIRGKSADYRKRHPDRVNRRNHNRRARLQDLPANLTDGEWEYARNYFNNCCAICGRRVDFWTVIARDHWMPVALGGGTTASNILPLCHTTTNVGGFIGCNNLKRAKHPEKWLVERYGKRKARNIMKRITAYFDSLN